MEGALQEAEKLEVFIDLFVVDARQEYVRAAVLAADADVGTPKAEGVALADRNIILAD